MEATMLSSEHIRAILAVHGAVPEHLRGNVWRFLLGLPNNKARYESYLAKGVHPELRDLKDRYPIADRQLFRRLQRCLSCIGWWWPASMQAPWLPQICFPWVKFWGADGCAAFECSVTLLTNHVSGFFEYSPAPPLSPLSFVQNTLASLSPAIVRNMHEAGVTPSVYIWPLLASMLADVLSAKEWLMAMDRLLVERPVYLHFLVAAWVVESQSGLMGSLTPEAVGTMVSRPSHAVNMTHLLR
ncbi:hypothetical protein KIPB_011454, partial [Kipferlia bialata]|eukprot:g11454.t1